MGLNTKIDYSESFPNAIKAEGRGSNFLVLRRLDKPIQRFDKKMAKYELEYRWLSCFCENPKDEAYVCIQGQDFTYWQEKEIKKALSGKSLFDCFNLF